MLRRARLDHARHVVVVAGTDANNVEIAAQARALSRDRGQNLSCSTQIQDPDLWYALRSWDVGTRDGFRLEFFNVTELGARALLARYSPFTANMREIRMGHPSGIIEMAGKVVRDGEGLAGGEDLGHPHGTPIDGGLTCWCPSGPSPRPPPSSEAGGQPGRYRET